MKKNNLKHHYVDGGWITGISTPLTSINPSNGEIIWQGSEAHEEEIAAAYEAAHLALTNWIRLDFEKRAKHMQDFSQQVESKRDELTRLISLETGKPLWESKTEVNAVIGKIRWSIQAYQERTGIQEISNPDATGYVRFKPHGVVAVLGAFNFPAHLSHGHIIPALLAGNTIIYKPSELTPTVAAFMIQCWHDSGLPPGVLNCVQGGVASAKLLLNLDVQGVFFTGSYKTGLHINRRFSDRPEVMLALEMGGNNPLIIDGVKNMQAALYQTLLSTMITAGQRCTCARRVLIPNNTEGDEFLKRFIKLCQTIKVGAFTSTPEPFMGPVIRNDHALTHLKAQKRFIQSGGESLLTMTLLSENTGFLSPGIIDMTSVANPADEEIFAPLVQIYRYDDFEHALMLANQTQYGLAAGLLSDSYDRYQQFYETIHAGLINWNRPTTGAASNMPFGGIGHSGNHRPSAYFAADYCAYPIASLEQPMLETPKQLLPGVDFDGI